MFIVLNNSVGYLNLLWQIVFLLKTSEYRGIRLELYCLEVSAAEQKWLGSTLWKWNSIWNLCNSETKTRKEGLRARKEGALKMGTYRKRVVGTQKDWVMIIYRFHVQLYQNQLCYS